MFNLRLHTDSVVLRDLVRVRARFEPAQKLQGYGDPNIPGILSRYQILGRLASVLAMPQLRLAHACAHAVQIF